MFDIAEQGVFGDIDKVEQRYVVEIINYLNYCKDKNKHLEEQQNRSSSRSDTLNKNRSRYK